MYTLCPHCHTVFRVRAEHLRAAHGEARCGRCGRLFDALLKLSDEYPSDDAHIPEAPAAAAPMSAQHAPPADAISGTPFGAADTPAESHRPDEVLFGPGPAPAAPPRRRSRLWLGAAAGLPLALIFILAVVYLQRDTLAAYPQARPWLESMCELAGCKLPLFRDTQNLRVVSRTVTAHPTLPGALEINLSFVNEAPYPQPYPTIQLRLLDINENVVSQHLFPPEIYLPDADMSRGLAPSERVQVVLEVADPGPDAENFRFDFR